MVVRLDAQGRKIGTPVVLQFTEYQGNEVTTGGDRLEQRPIGRLLCYELRSEDTSKPFSWSVCTGVPYFLFHLHNTGTGGNYLAWVRGNCVVMAEVSHGRTRA